MARACNNVSQWCSLGWGQLAMTTKSCTPRRTAEHLRKAQVVADEGRDRELLAREYNRLIAGSVVLRLAAIGEWVHLAVADDLAALRVKDNRLVAPASVRPHSRHAAEHKDVEFPRSAR